MKNRYVSLVFLLVGIVASPSLFAQPLTCCCDACPGFECVTNSTGDCNVSCQVASGFSCFTGIGSGDTVCPAAPACTPLPVEFSAVSAVSDGRSVLVQWNTATESNNVGFELQRSVSPGLFEEVAFIDGAGSTLEPQSYSYRVEGLDPGTQIFRLKQLDFDGTFSYSAVVEVTVNLPTKYVLDPAYPNPFNPSTSVRYAVDTEQMVRIELFDAYGQSVRTVYEGSVEANNFQTVQVHGHGLATGMYMLRLQGERFVATQKLVLVK